LSTNDAILLRWKYVFSVPINPVPYVSRVQNKEQQAKDRALQNRAYDIDMCKSFLVYTIINKWAQVFA